MLKKNHSTVWSKSWQIFFLRWSVFSTNTPNICVWVCECEHVCVCERERSVQEYSGSTFQLIIRWLYKYKYHLLCVRIVKSHCRMTIVKIHHYMTYYYGKYSYGFQKQNKKQQLPHTAYFGYHKKKGWCRIPQLETKKKKTTKDTVKLL